MIKCTADRELYELISAERKLTVDVAIQSTHLENLIKSYGERDVITAITGAIIMAGEFFNVKDGITEAQAVQTASLFIDQFPLESFEDLLLCLKNAKLGKYGKVYNRLDGQMIFDWFRMYLDEKYERFEQIKKQEKEDAQAVTFNSFYPMLKQILAEKEENKQKDDSAPKRITSENHFKQFSEALPLLTKNQLKESLKYYQEQNSMTMRRQFQPYIDLLEQTLKNYTK